MKAFAGFLKTLTDLPVLSKLGQSKWAVMLLPIGIALARIFERWAAGPEAFYVILLASCCAFLTIVELVQDLVGPRAEAARRKYFDGAAGPSAPGGEDTVKIDRPAA